MGRNSTLKLIAMKPTHFKELWGMIAGYERPMHASGLRPAREACESCHWPQAEHHDSITVNKRYGTDPKSSEIDYRLTLHTTANVEREIPWKVTGIHWHIANDVQFKSPDVQGGSIPWVQVIEARRYQGHVSSMRARSCRRRKLAKLERAAHGVLQLPQRGRASVPQPCRPRRRGDRRRARSTASCPAVKARAVAMINAAGDLSGPMAERAAAIDKLLADYAAKSPPPAEPEGEGRAVPEGHERDPAVELLR